jgi:hypothetical protein
MSLMDDLRTVAASLDPSLAPSSNEVGPLLGALIAYTEHGDKIVQAAEDGGSAGVSDLLAPAADDTKSSSSAKSGSGSGSSSSKGEK